MQFFIHNYKTKQYKSYLIRTEIQNSYYSLTLTVLVLKLIEWYDQKFALLSFVFYIIKFLVLVILIF